MIRNKVIDICSGPHHTLVLTENGDVYAWGKDDWGRLQILLKMDANILVPYWNFKIILEDNLLD